MAHLNRMIYAAAAAFTIMAAGYPLATEAADAEASNTGELQEVIVTARRTAENLQSVPVTVQSISGDDLAQIKSTQDLTGLVPGLVFQNFGPTPLISLRGQGSRLGGSTSVGVFEDGANLPTYYITAAGNIDTARIEVDKGPQSALYGRGTLDGAINIVTNDPTKTNEGFFEGGYGGSTSAGEKLWDAKAVLSGPLTSDGTLSGRLVLAREVRTGYVYAANNTDWRGDGYDRYTAKVKLLWEPSENLAVRLSGVSVEDRAAQRAETRAGSDLPPLGWVINQQDNSAAAAPYINSGRVFGSNVWQAYYARPQTGQDFNHLGTLDIRYTTPYGEFASLTYGGTETWNERSSVDDSTLGLADIWSEYYEYRYSQEFRFSGSQGPFSYLAGLYYLYSHQDSGDPGPTLDLNAPALTWYYGSGQYDMPSINAINPSKNVVAEYLPGYTNLTTKSVFARLGYDVTDALNITAALRYGEDIVAGTTSTYETRGDGTLITLLAPTWRSAQFDATTGNFTVSYKFTPDVMGYASYARGNSPGGLNSGASAAAAETPYKPQDVDSYELGLKSMFLERHLRVNATLFDSQYTNLQVSRAQYIPVPGGAPGQTVFATVVTNAAKSYGRGLDLDAAAILSAHWNANLGYTYLMSKLTDYVLPAAVAGAALPIDLSGTPILRSPKNSGDVSLNFHTQIDRGVLSLTGGMYFSSGYANDLLGVPPGTAYPGRPGIPAGVTTSQFIWTIPTDAYWTARLEGSYTLGPWKISAFARNLFNRQYIASAAGNYPYQSASTVPGEPRTWELLIRRSL